ncbi:hypothetical protein KAH81_09220, partial [bacterium]|nr:hypothetical protein [bacterium]
MKVPSLLIISLYLILLFNNGCAVIDNFKAEDIVLPANKTSQDIPVGLYKVTQSSFTYREADLGSQKLERIEPGSIVEVVDVAGAFAQIKFSENTTWLKKNQVEETNVPDVVRTLGRVRSKEGPSELAQEMVILESGRLLTV